MNEQEGHEDARNESARNGGATGQPGTPLQPVDRAAIGMVQRAGGADLVAKLTALFLDDASPRFAALREAQDDGERVRLAHGLQTNCRMMGATRMAEVCGHLVDLAERDGRSDPSLVCPEPDGFCGQVDALEAAFPEVRAWLEQVREAALRGESPPAA